MPAHPLDQDALGLRGQGFLRLEREARGPGWHRCADVLDGSGPLQDWTARVTRWLRRTYSDEPHPSVAPTYLMGWYLDAVARTGATWVVLCSRLPALGPQHLALHETPGGWPDAVAVLGKGFTCLPGDPAAGHQDAHVVADRTALLGVLDDEVRRHAAAFHAVFRPAVRTGSRQRWGMVDDVLEISLWAARQLAGERGVPAPGVRRSCCFAYRLDPALLCERCPRRA